MERTCETTLRFISGDWNLPLAPSNSWPFLFSYGFIFNDRNKEMHELLLKNIKCFCNKLYGQLDITLLPSISRFSGFFRAPWVCGVLCYGYRIWRKRRKCSLESRDRVSPWNPGDYRLCKYFHFQFIWNEKEDRVYSRLNLSLLNFSTEKCDMTIWRELWVLGLQKNGNVECLSS